MVGLVEAVGQEDPLILSAVHGMISISTVYKYMFLEVFNKLSRKSILSVVDLRLADVAARVRDRRMSLDVDDAARQWLADKGYSDVYGARAIARVVRTEVLFPLAQKLLSGTIR